MCACVLRSNHRAVGLFARADHGPTLERTSTAIPVCTSQGPSQNPRLLLKLMNYATISQKPIYLVCTPVIVAWFNYLNSKPTFGLQIPMRSLQTRSIAGPSDPHGIGGCTLGADCSKLFTWASLLYSDALGKYILMILVPQFLGQRNTVLVDTHIRYVYAYMYVSNIPQRSFRLLTQLQSYTWSCITKAGSHQRIAAELLCRKRGSQLRAPGDCGYNICI